MGFGFCYLGFQKTPKIKPKTIQILRLTAFFVVVVAVVVVAVVVVAVVVVAVVVDVNVVNVVTA